MVDQSWIIENLLQTEGLIEPTYSGAVSAPPSACLDPDFNPWDADEV